MSTRGQAINSTFEVVRLPHIQIGKKLLMYFPDPDSAFIGGAGVAWSWEIYNDTDAVIVTVGAEVSATADYRTVDLASPTYVAGKRYRVRIFDDAAVLRDEWYFVAYTSNFAGLPPINVASINDAIARIAGLLGLNQVVTHNAIELGVPVETNIKLYDKDPADPAAVLIGEYEQRKFLDLQGRVDSEVSSRIS